MLRLRRAKTLCSPLPQIKIKIHSLTYPVEDTRSGSALLALTCLRRFQQGLQFGSARRGRTRQKKIKQLTGLSVQCIANSSTPPNSLTSLSLLCVPSCTSGRVRTSASTPSRLHMHCTYTTLHTDILSARTGDFGSRTRPDRGRYRGGGPPEKGFSFLCRYIIYK